VKIAILVGLTLINLYFFVNFSVGDRYVARLNNWYSLALENKWSDANKLEKNLDQADLKWFKDKYKTENLKKRLNELTVKINKNTDDWMEIAQIQRGLNDKTAEKQAIKTAHELDLIRSDVEKIYFSSFFSAAF